VASPHVGQQLLASQTAMAAMVEPLFFWVSESAHANAETDYLLLGIRLHAGPFADERHEVRMPEGPLRYRLLSLPLYLAEEVVPLLERLGP
jgi:hypothetical protein